MARKTRYLTEPTNFQETTERGRIPDLSFDFNSVVFLGIVHKYLLSSCPLKRAPLTKADDVHSLETLLDGIRSCDFNDVIYTFTGL